MLLRTLFGFLSFLIINTVVVAETQSTKPVIAITQIAPHPSLDRIRQGIEDGLKAQQIDADIRFDQASGDIAIATQIAQKFVSLNPAIIIPISTPSAQTVYQQAKNKGIPVVFAAVSDPIAAKLVASDTMKGKGITGISDLSPIEDQIDLMLELQPRLKKIGVLHNPGETNSTAIIARLQKLAVEKNIEIVVISCPTSKDVPQGVKKLLDIVEAIYIPNDNTIISALDTIIKISADKLPVYAADPESVGRGCLASVAHSQYEIGRAVARVAADVLKGTRPDDIAVTTPETVEVTINRSVAKRLGLIAPKSFKQHLITYIGAQ